MCQQYGCGVGEKLEQAFWYCIKETVADSEAMKGDAKGNENMNAAIVKS